MNLKCNKKELYELVFAFDALKTIHLANYLTSLALCLMLYLGVCVCLNNEPRRTTEDSCRGKTASTISFICAEM